MALTTDQARKAHIAFNRFGLGAKPGGPEEINTGTDPKRALIAELNRNGIAQINNTSLPNYVTACRAGTRGFEEAEDIRSRELNARVAKQMQVQIGFVERLVIFWSNHFSMTVNKNETIRATIGQWERDVIRKNVLGKFHDMLRETINHPAMVSYLDNEDSIGPNSETGLNWGAGYNENLAREIMELHTVGSGGNPPHYTEADVTAFAKILTGWSYVRSWEAEGRWNGGNESNRGQFIYRRTWHEPGTIRLRGKNYAPGGAAGKNQAENVLIDLAADPATAEFIAFKLVRHFITDEPTPEMVNPLKQAFIDTEGDLKAVARALIELPEAWSLPFEKVRTPYEMLIAHYRALNKRYAANEEWMFWYPLSTLHQTPWEAPSPKGYYDDTAIWLNPDGSRIRLDIAQASSEWYMPDYKGNAVTLADKLFDTALTKATRDRILALQNDTTNWSARNDALTTLLSCPEFQRR